MELRVSLGLGRLSEPVSLGECWLIPRTGTWFLHPCVYWLRCGGQSGEMWSHESQWGTEKRESGLCACVSGRELALRCDQTAITQCLVGKGRAPLRDFPGGIAGRGSGNLGISQARRHQPGVAGESWRGKAWARLERCERETGLASLLPGAHSSASSAALRTPRSRATSPSSWHPHI